jgi:hypothetical protein
MFIFATTFTVGVLCSAPNFVSAQVSLASLASSLLTSIWRANLGL